MIKEPKIQRIQYTKYVRLLEDYSYYSKRLGKTIYIDAGFIFDGASIPPCFWSIVGHPLDTYLAAALVHDWCYRVGDDPRRILCDRVFLDMLKELAIPLWKRKTMYRYVRLMGWYPWNNYRKLDPQIKNKPNMVFEGIIT